MHRLYGDNDLVPYMRAKRLQWARNAARKFGNMILKRIVEGGPGGRTPAGKPMNRWNGEVHKEAAKLLSALRQDIGGMGGKTGEAMAENGPKNDKKKGRKKKPNGYVLVYQILII